mgnify:CR=1 FL=1
MLKTIYVKIIPTNSNAIESIDYVPDKFILHVKLKNGDEYNYLDVGNDVFQQLLESNSVDLFYFNQIKGIFHCELINANNKSEIISGSMDYTADTKIKEYSELNCNNNQIKYNSELTNNIDNNKNENIKECECLLDSIQFPTREELLKRKKEKTKEILLKIANDVKNAMQQLGEPDVNSVNVQFVMNHYNKLSPLVQKLKKLGYDVYLENNCISICL